MIKSAIQGLLIISLAIAFSLILAEDRRKLPIIGFVVPVDPVTDAPYQKAFREGLRNLGWVDGKNITILAQYANGDPTKLRAIIQQFIALPVDILVGDAPVLAQATKTIPIVSETMSDPVRNGLVSSLARPGGNLTGVSAQTYDLWPKRLQLAKELVPNLKRLYFLFDTHDEPYSLTYADAEFKPLAAAEGITVRNLSVVTLEDVHVALRIIQKERPEALMVWSSPLLTQERRRILEAIGHQLPVISDGRFFAEAGVLLSYSVDWVDMFTCSAGYVDRILRGAKPGDLPIEQPTKFKLVLNLKTAKALGVKVPQSMLAGADEMIR